jgi:hypothetical protein
MVPERLDERDECVSGARGVDECKNLDESVLGPFVVPSDLCHSFVLWPHSHSPQWTRPSLHLSALCCIILPSNSPSLGHTTRAYSTTHDREYKYLALASDVLYVEVLLILFRQEDEGTGFPESLTGLNRLHAE